MASRGELTEELNRIEQDLKQLEITYEQYFLGLEKRAPERERHAFLLRMRRMIGEYIPQTDIRFRLQSITSRFNSYCSHWDRTQRLIDEGKYERHTSKMQRRAAAAGPLPQTGDVARTNPVDSLYEDLLKAHEACSTAPPQRAQVAKFLAKQKEAIQQKFGDRQVEFQVVTENGKPKVKVRAKR